MSIVERNENDPSMDAVDAAAELIQTIDFAFAELSFSANSAADDAVEARNNAKTAARLAKRYTNTNINMNGNGNGNCTTSTNSSYDNGGSPYAPTKRREELQFNFNLSPSLDRSTSSSLKSDNHGPNRRVRSGNDDEGGGWQDISTYTFDTDESYLGMEEEEHDERQHEHQHDLDKSTIPQSVDPTIAKIDDDHRNHDNDILSIDHNDDINTNDDRALVILDDGNNANLPNHDDDPNSTATPRSRSPRSRPSLIDKVTELERRLQSERTNHSRTKRALALLQTSTHELSQSHSNDVLSLSLEIEKLKRDLVTSQRLLSTEKVLRGGELEEHRSTGEEVRELRIRVRELEEVKEERDHLRYRAEAAEEDAEKALNLARGCDEERREMGELLHYTLNVIEELRGGSGGGGDDGGGDDEMNGISEGGNDEMIVRSEDIPKEGNTATEEIPARELAILESTSLDTLPIITEESTAASIEEYDDDDTPQKDGSHPMPTTTNNSNSPVLAPRSSSEREKSKLKALISTTTDGISIPKGSTRYDDDDDDGRSNDNNSYNDELSPRKKAEKIRKLRESSNRSTEVGTNGREMVRYDDREEYRSNGGTSAIRTCNVVGEMLRRSGRKLNLDSRWFTAKSNSTTTTTTTSGRRGDREDHNHHNHNHHLDLESMARDYCKYVEMSISSQRNKVKDLEAFNGYLEEMIANK